MSVLATSLTAAEERVRRAGEAAGRRGIDLGSALDAWLARGGGTKAEQEGSRAAAEAVALPFAGPDGRLEAGRAPKPIVVDGANPAWLLRRVFDATGPAPDGYSPRLFVTQRDAGELVEAASSVALDDILDSPRVTWCVGADAAERLFAALTAQLDLALPRFVLAAPGASAPVLPAGVVERAVAEQERLHERLRAAALATYTGRGREWWTGRYARACAPGTSEPLRVLLPVSRYSTFVRHSAADLAESLRELGHEARVLTEPDDHSRLASPAYLRQFAEWRPDLVVLINYTRQHMGQAVIPGVPVVCWIQDAMPQLFSAQVGAAQGDLDFVAGYLPAELFDRFGYRRKSTLNSPVVVSPRKFHCGVAAPYVRRGLECEVAYVSHQSEPPGTFLARMLAASKPGTPAHRAVELAAPLLDDAVERSMRVVVMTAVDEAALSALRSATGAEPDPRVVAVFKHQFCAPYAERQFRHQALVWAAAIARSRGWRMRLFGNGWDRHPGLAEFAAGPLEHGEALRASYQSAAVHLHMSTYSVVHQRVMECALSGGFPACRLQRREVDSVCHRLLEEAVRTGVPHSVSVNGYAYYRTEDCPSLAVRAALEEGLGIEARRSYVASPAVMERVRSLPPGVDLFQADLLLGDLVTRTFHDRASLEALLVRAVEQPGWRGEALASIARRVRESMTYDVFCRRLLGLLTARLGGDERSVW